MPVTQGCDLDLELTTALTHIEEMLLTVAARYEHIPLRSAAGNPSHPAILADVVAVFTAPGAPDHVRL